MRNDCPVLHREEGSAQRLCKSRILLSFIIRRTYESWRERPFAPVLPPVACRAFSSLRSHDIIGLECPQEDKLSFKWWWWCVCGGGGHNPSHKLRKLSLTFVLIVDAERKASQADIWLKMVIIPLKRSRDLTKSSSGVRLRRQSSRGFHWLQLGLVFDLKTLWFWTLKPSNCLRPLSWSLTGIVFVSGMFGLYSLQINVTAGNGWLKNGSLPLEL